jgi:hypothetical protein
MGRAHTESKTHTFKKDVTFVTGFGIVADEPIHIGSGTTANTDLIIHNKLLLGNCFSSSDFLELHGPG